MDGTPFSCALQDPTDSLNESDPFNIFIDNAQYSVFLNTETNAVPYNTATANKYTKNYRLVETMQQKLRLPGIDQDTSEDNGSRLPPFLPSSIPPSESLFDIADPSDCSATSDRHVQFLDMGPSSSNDAGTTESTAPSHQIHIKW